MFFGRVPPDQAEGGVLAHRVQAGERVFGKGHRLSAADCAAILAAGVGSVTIARLEAGDVDEDQAAAALAAAVAGAGVRVAEAFTGRANLFAEHAGILSVDRARIDAFNCIDEALTIATLPAFRRVEAGEMIGTVKIIPFAVPEAINRSGLAVLAGEPAMSVRKFVGLRVGVLSLRLPNLKESVIDKTLKVTEARLAALDARLVLDERLPHDETALAEALAVLRSAAFDLLIVFGAAAITDRRDVIPRAIERVGGRIEHLGMPVDPGNLLLIGEVFGKAVIGAPGCARSPKENGFDWVLERLAAGIPVLRADIVGMGVGGLLMEIVSRPQPRAGHVAAGEGLRIGALILAAGRSTRFGAANKLTASFSGKPMLAHAVEAALAAGLEDVMVVTGHESEAVRAALAGAAARFVHNADYASGLASSLRAGLAALPAEIGAAFVMLGDMPRIAPETLRALVAAAEAAAEPLAFVPAHKGRWGNPVLVRRALFPALSELVGDQGARKLLEGQREVVREVDVDDLGIFADFDTAAALASAEEAAQ